MAYSITVDKLENLHETLKQFVREVNEFAWDMRQKGLGVLMPEEIEIKVTLIDEDAGNFTETETVSGGGKTTVATTVDEKGARTETQNITDTDVIKVTTETQNILDTEEVKISTETQNILDTEEVKLTTETQDISDTDE